MVTKTGDRRTPEETLKTALEAKALIDGGMTKEGKDGALAKVGIAKSVYDRYAKGGFRPKPLGQRSAVQRGTMRVDQLPPRPRSKKGGKRTPKPVDMSDISSVAARIAKLDKKLRGIQEMVDERIKLV